MVSTRHQKHKAVEKSAIESIKKSKKHKALGLLKKFARAKKKGLRGTKTESEKNVKYKDKTDLNLENKGISDRICANTQPNSKFRRMARKRHAKALFDRCPKPKQIWYCPYKARRGPKPRKGQPDNRAYKNFKGSCRKKPVSYRVT